MNNEAIEVSNGLKDIKIEMVRRCPMSAVHLKCPINVLKKEYDDSINVKALFEFLKQVKEAECKADLKLFLYSEASADCKLSYIIHYIREHLGMTNRIRFETNGWGVDEKTLKMLFKIGLTKTIIVCYDKDTYKRFGDIQKIVRKDLDLEESRLRVRYTPAEGGITCDTDSNKECPGYAHDTRLSYYDNLEGKVVGIDPNKFFCPRPKGMICIQSNGNVVNCDREWKGKIKFGNIYEDSFETILLNKKKFIDMIFNGKLAPDICAKRCPDGTRVVMGQFTRRER